MSNFIDSKFETSETFKREALPVDEFPNIERLDHHRAALEYLKNPAAANDPYTADDTAPDLKTFWQELREQLAGPQLPPTVADKLAKLRKGIRRKIGIE